MSSSSRAASKGGKGTKTDKSHKSEKSESGKGGDKQQHRDANSKSEDPSIKDKVKTLIEMTQRSEEEVCYALHECDHDLNQATNMLYESMGTGEWETRVKKKKTRQASASKQEKSEENAPVDGWDENVSPGAQQGEKERPRNRNGPPPRLYRQNDSRGWRGRERQENDRNLDDSGRPDYQRDRDRRGRPGGPRGGGGSRGRGGGRAGGRYPPRGNRSNSYNKPIETWDNSNNTWDNSTALAATNNNAEESWDEFPGTDEWTTEEYQGSLADTKVFTPSVPPSLDAIAEPPGGGGQAMPGDPTMTNQQLGGQTLQMGQGMQMPSQSPVPPMVGALTAAQTQYFSQLQQNNDTLSKQYVPSQTTYEKSPSAQYNSGASMPYNSSSAGAQYNANAASQYNSISTSQYGSASSPQYSNTQQYGGQGNAYADVGYQAVNAGYGVPEAAPAQQPPRAKTQRARVPPPSKIPASAVEMPGDLNSSMGYLDVQFGAMDLIDSNSSFDSAIDNKYSAQSNNMDVSNATAPSPLDLNPAGQNPNLDAYSPKTNAQSSISSALSQSLANTDIPQTSEHLANSTYSSVPRGTTQGVGTSTTGVSGAAAAAGGLELTKQPDSHSYSQPSTYNSYQSKANTYNTSSYSPATTTASSYVSNQANSYVNVNNQSGGGGYSAPSANAYPNAYSSNSSYQSTTNSATFPSISQANTYSSNNQTYPQNTSQSVYGANTGLNNSTYGNTSTSQYNSYSSNNKIVKDNSYDGSSNATSVSQTAATTNVTSSVPISLSQTTISVSKTSTTLAAKNSNSVVSNIPPCVTPVMSTPYIMGQVPYFQQPVYSYEDMQLLQQRLPHMTTPYYDMSYQTPTTLAQVRDAAALGNVGYSLSSDGRFARTDNNASPVPSTLSSQQTSALTQGHQAQPILAGTAPPPYFFATAFNTIAPNYQFGTMYTQLPAATNAHGSNNSTQFKQATYGSGYGSYDALSQSQDYTKGAYVGNTPAQKAAVANASSTGSAGNDLSAMYAKSHTALGKVNSYEKQGFHSGTPPPFTGALHGSQSGGLAPSGTGYAPQVYIPTMAPHQQHHSTHLMQQPLHQMDVRHQGRRVDSGNTGGQRSQTSNQAKTGAKQPYQTSYWNQA